MPCTRPLKAYRAAGGGISFASAGRAGGYADRPLQLPCGKCPSCKLERSRQWSVRMKHEMLMHPENCFITLTYSPEELPKDGSLDVSHWQKFAKRLKKRVKFRHFMCGEYGEVNKRPHYHAILFGCDFPDKKFWKEERGNRLYVSPMLEETWGHGFTSVGEATSQSAAYVARYCQKKVSEPYDDGSVDEYLARYGRWCSDTGDFWTVRPEFTTMSRRPGIGSEWFKKYKSDVYPHDEVIMDGRRYRPPRYYDNQLDEEELAGYKAKRIAAVQRKGQISEAGLRSFEKHKEAQVNLLKRHI